MAVKWLNKPVILGKLAWSPFHRLIRSVGRAVVNKLSSPGG
jgi:hypothetical protein